MKRVLSVLSVLFRFHVLGSVAIVAAVGYVLAGRMEDRTTFADSELHRDVMDLWGAPIRQPAPSVRYVPSGTVFKALLPLPLDRQEVSVDAAMNYRKRGLVYFSGFDFAFRGEYRIVNPEARDIDVVFVFPIDLQKNRTLLSELDFQVDGAPAHADLSGGDKLVWTGRIRAGGKVDLRVGFHGRGLDTLTYDLDSNAPVRNFHFAVHISGGRGFDYQEGVVSAGETRVQGKETWLDWRYPSLESGIPVGVTLPAEQAFDRLIATMVGRAWAPFLLLCAALAALSIAGRRRLHFWESYLVAAGYALFFVLLAYAAAFLNFYAAWALSLAVAGGLVFAYLRRLLPAARPFLLAGLLVSTLAVPTAAVFLEGYTGLIYTIEATGLVAALMVLTAREGFGARLADALRPVPQSLSDSIQKEDPTHA